jgi:hypothetical protein
MTVDINPTCHMVRVETTNMLPAVREIVSLTAFGV